MHHVGGHRLAKGGQAVVHVRANRGLRAAGYLRDFLVRQPFPDAQGHHGALLRGQFMHGPRDQISGFAGNRRLCRRDLSRIGCSRRIGFDFKCRPGGFAEIGPALVQRNREEPGLEWSRKLVLTALLLHREKHFLK